MGEMQLTDPVDKKEQPARNFARGRFGWLIFLLYLFSGEIFVLSFRPGGWYIFIIYFIFQAVFGTLIFWLGRRIHADDHFIPFSFRNLLLPWPRSVIIVACVTVLMGMALFPLITFLFFPFSNLDILRQANGGIRRVEEEAYHLSFSRNGAFLAVADFSGSPLKILSYPDLKPVFSIDRKLINDQAISSNGETLAICYLDAPLEVLNTRTGKSLTQYTGDEDCHVLFSGDDHYLIVSEKEKISIMDMTGVVEDRHLSIPNITFLALSSDDQWLAAGNPQEVTIIDLPEGKIIQTIQRIEIASPDWYSVISDIAMTPDGQFLITVTSVNSSNSDSDYSLIETWRISNGEPAARLKMENVNITEISLSQDGQYLTGALDQIRQRDIGFVTTPVWQIPTLEQVKWVFSDDYGQTSAAFSPMDNRIILGTSNKFDIWERP